MASPGQMMEVARAEPLTPLQRGISQSYDPAQRRAAHALLDWSRERLAEASETYVSTVRNFENGGSEPKRSTLIA